MMKSYQRRGVFGDGAYLSPRIRRLHLRVTLVTLLFMAVGLLGRLLWSQDSRTTYYGFQPPLWAKAAQILGLLGIALTLGILLGGSMQLRETRRREQSGCCTICGDPRPASGAACEECGTTAFVASPPDAASLKEQDRPAHA